ncbi:hypothetical protein MKX01_004753 [Papaver californicum]|nr:hypothetical protein MKX01_004753 [Papaver californicum]
MGDIRKWLMKSHDKNDATEPAAKPSAALLPPVKPAAIIPQTEKPPYRGQERLGRKKTSRYFATKADKSEDEQEVEKTALDDGVKPPPVKKLRKAKKEEDDDDDVFEPSPAKKLKSVPRKGVKKSVEIDQNDEDDDVVGGTPRKPAGRGSGGRSSAAAPAGSPEGAPHCLAGKTFVISGTLDSLEREEAEDLIKRHGGRVTGSVSKKTNYLLADEDIGGRKSEKAKELGTAFLTKDGWCYLATKRKPSESSKGYEVSPSLEKKTPQKGLAQGVSPAKRKTQAAADSSLTWPEKYKPKTPNDILGNQSLVKQLHEWLSHWNDHFLHTGQQGKGKIQNDNGAKKAVLIGGSPGIGKSTSAKLVSQMLGFQGIEVNASDSRGKADSKILKGIGGSMENSIKELVSNEPLGVKTSKDCLMMDEVDGMSSGDRGGTADLIASIKISKIPIFCICNDRYSQKLKSLLNYCLLLNYRKPTKQQMAKRLMQVATTEGVKVNEIALEKLADRVNGDMLRRMRIFHRLLLLTSCLVLMVGLRMDERVDLCMSDADLVPLLIQENYLNYRPSAVDTNSGSSFKLLASSVVPAALLHGQREILEQGERNFNRFGGWLGKNSTMGKNMRLLEDVHVHLLASRESISHRETLRVDYFPLIRKHLLDPLRSLLKDEAEDYDSIMELSQFKKHPNPVEGIQPAVKAALPKSYKQGSSSRFKKAPKKRIAAMLEPVDSGGLTEENGDMLGESEEENASDTEDTYGPDNGEKKLHLYLQSNSKKGIQVQLDLKDTGKSSAKKAPASKIKSSICFCICKEKQSQYRW